MATKAKKETKPAAELEVFHLIDSNITFTMCPAFCYILPTRKHWSASKDTSHTHKFTYNIF